MEVNKETNKDVNKDIEDIDDINVLTDIYIKEAKEANELSKKLELITERFTLIRDKITSLRHLQDDKSEDKEELSENEIIEKPKKVKKTPVKEPKKEAKKETKKETKTKKEVKPEPTIEEIEKDVEDKVEIKTKKEKEVVEAEPAKKTKGRKKKEV